MIAPIEFAGPNAAADVLAAYDRDHDTWRMPREGRFWEAVARAHAAGARGQGRRIAVIDGAVDFTIPRIAARTGGRAILAAGPRESNVHGTAVVLLVSTVAPDAMIDVYEVSRGGRADPDAVAAALARIAGTDAAIVSMSLGRPTEIELPREIEDDPSALIAYALRHAGAKPVRPEEPPCALCAGAARLCDAGRMVFAAAGNDRGHAFCPARAPQVVAVGFQLEAREVRTMSDGGVYETAEFQEPSYAQSPIVDLSVMQPRGVLGSSFACPLLAGAAALGLDAIDLPRFVASAALCAVADVFMALPPDPQLGQFLDAHYRAALALHPHHHDLAAEPPCFACAVLAEPLHVNGGLFYLRAGRLDEAERLLRTARWFAPTNPHAAANLGRLLQARAEVAHDAGDHRAARAFLDEAAAEYRVALGVRPGFPVYVHQLAEIEGLARAWP